MDNYVIGLVVSALVPKLLELLKPKRWAPFVRDYAPTLNRITAVLVALVTAIGVTVDFDVTAGVLTIGGLLPDQIIRTGLTWALNFAIQEAVYRRLVNAPSRVPSSARRGGLS